MKLTKQIPARTQTLKVKACRPWVLMTPSFREIRDGTKNELGRCCDCEQSIADGERTWLAVCEAHVNVVCEACAKRMIGEAGK